MSEIVVDAIVDVDTFKKFIGVMTPLVGEARIHFNDDGAHMMAVDAGNVCMGRVELDADAFESYESGAVTVGANLVRVDDRLDVADSGDLVNVSVDMEARKLSVDVGNVDQQVAMIDPDAIRDEPDIPDLDLPNTLRVTGDQLDTVQKVADMVSDHLAVESLPDSEKARFVAEGDTDESDVEFGHDEALEGTKLDEQTLSLFSLEYFKNMVGAIPSDAEVSIRFGEEHPMKFQWEDQDGHLSVEQMLAPRIQSG